MNAYIVRSDWSRDNPPIVLVTLDKTIAENLIESMARKQYEKIRHDKLIDMKHSREMVEFADAHPDIRFPRYIQYSIDSSRERIENDQRVFDEGYATYEKWREYKYTKLDWYMEEIPYLTSEVEVAQFIEDKYPLEHKIYHVNDCHPGQE